MSSAGPQLTESGCAARLERLIAGMHASDLFDALLLNPRHIHYVTGYWRAGRSLTPAALVLRCDCTPLLFVPAGSERLVPGAAVITYVADRIGTLVEDPLESLAQAVKPHLEGVKQLAVDAPVPEEMAHIPCFMPLSWVLDKLRRRKDPDEVEMIRHAILGCEAAYAWARDNLKAGMTEMALYAGMLAAATEAVGEPLTEFGNDFQCGAIGGLPRLRPAEGGEAAILDVSVVYRGYSSDLCRTFVVGGAPNEEQLAAHGRVLAALEYIEANAGPATRCVDLYRVVSEMLLAPRPNCHSGDSHRWSFPHHLGHGVGLSAHEAPRLNPNWDDVLEVGDVFAAEPGLYGAGLRAGVRVEQDYLVTESGVRRLSNYPVELA